MWRCVKIKKYIALFLIVLTLAVSTFFGLQQIRPPYLSAQSGKEQGYQNVLTHAQTIAALEDQTKNAGGESLVQEYIAAQIESMGITPVLESFTSDDIEPEPNKGTLGNILQESGAERQLGAGAFKAEDTGGVSQSKNVYYNVSAKVETPGKGNAILFVAHYTNGPNSSAGENALAVSSMLQLMQSLAQHSSQQTNDIYFLFTESELGKESLGVQHFISTNPGYKGEIQLVFNFESQSGTEAVLMLQASSGNYDLVPSWAHALAQPLGFSLSSEVYGELPTNGSFDWLLQNGYKGMSFATLQSASNKAQRLTPNTAYQYYKTVLSLGEYYAKQDIDNLASERNAAYFPFFWGNLVVMPYNVTYILAFVPLVLALAMLAMEIRRKQVRGLSLLTRAVVLITLGIAPAVTTVLFPSVGYLLIFPVLFFLPVQFFLTIFHRPRKSIVMPLLMLAIFVTVMLYVPIIYLAQHILGSFAITALLSAVPVVLILGYSARTLWTFSKKAMA